MTRSFIARLLVGAGLAGIAAVTVGNVRHRSTWTTATLVITTSRMAISQAIL